MATELVTCPRCGQTVAGDGNGNPMTHTIPGGNALEICK